MPNHIIKIEVSVEISPKNGLRVTNMRKSTFAQFSFSEIKPKLIPLQCLSLTPDLYPNVNTFVSGWQLYKHVHSGLVAFGMLYELNRWQYRMKSDLPNIVLLIQMKNCRIRECETCKSVGKLYIHWFSLAHV